MKIVLAVLAVLSFSVAAVAPAMANCQTNCTPQWGGGYTCNTYCW